MIDAFRRASAGRITAVIPYFAYGRSDKKDQPRVPITARLIANMIETAGADRVLTVDLHAGQIQGFFNIPVDEMTALYTLSRHFQEQELEDLVVVATDLGAAKRARNVAERLGAPLALMEKRRVGNNDLAETMTIIGEVRGKQALIVDDEVDTAGTLMETVKALCDHGVTSVRAAATHAVLSGPAMKRISNSPLEELVVTDTLPVAPEKQISKIQRSRSLRCWEKRSRTSIPANRSAACSTKDPTMLKGIVTKIVGDPNAKEIKRLQPIVDEINALEPEMQELSDEELRAKTDEFRDRFAGGEALDDLLPEAFAVVREASRRTTGLRHFDVQLIGGIVLHQGNIAEMKTGEGKTLVASLPLYLNALVGRGAHLVTVNDYLAKRDPQYMGPGQIFSFLGLTVGVLQHESAFLYSPEDT